MSSCSQYDDGICEALFCRFDTIKTCMAVVYRPPSSPIQNFKSTLNFLREHITELGDDSFQLCVTGDFNLPGIQWESNTATEGPDSYLGQSARVLLDYMADTLSSQYVFVPTRGSNILDLFITNDNRLVTNVKATETHLSDHDLVDIMLSYNPLSQEKVTKASFNDQEFRSLDFSKADFNKLNFDLANEDWISERKKCTFEEFPKVFTDRVFQICKTAVPAKVVPNGRPKHLNALRRKRKKLELRIRALKSRGGNPEHTQALALKLALVHYEIKESINNELDLKEKKAISKIKDKPKYFYSYAKSLSKTRSSINMLFDKDETIDTDPKGIANILQEQFQSVFSDPNSPLVKDPDFPAITIDKEFKLDGLNLSDSDVIKAIKQISVDAASGPDGIPAILLLRCAEALCSPIRLIWTESFESGKVPEFYKSTHISPIYKKGDRARAKNYRPIALTSHIIKVYERILRERMVRFIEDNKIICPNQHGFQAGKSCLTQLLSHIDDILQGLGENCDTDAIYLDFAKVFDKVDHRLLLLKLKRYGFPEKVIRWIESFLTGRLQTVGLTE